MRVAVGVGVVAATLGAGVAFATVVLPGDTVPTPIASPGSWGPANERDGGVSAITGARPDQGGGNGSLAHSLPALSGNSPKTDYEIYAPGTSFDQAAGLQAAGGFGLLSDLNTLSFDWWRDSTSTAPSHLTPALRLYVFDPDAGQNGSSYLMIWEGVYNGYPQANGPVPTDQWVSEEISGENFWRIPLYLDGLFAGISWCNVPANAPPCFVFNKGLGDWGLGPNTVVFGVNVGIGSGWAGSYSGFVDLIDLTFPTTGFNWDFELTAATTTTSSTTTTTTTTIAPTTTVAPTTSTTVLATTTTDGAANLPTTLAPSTTLGTVLPETGSDENVMAMMAVLLLSAGGALVALTRRRHL